MKRLVIAPHVDDDVLGCAGVLGADTVTFYCGVDDEHNGATALDRMIEADAVYAQTGGRYYWPVGRGNPSDVLDLWPGSSTDRRSEYGGCRMVNGYPWVLQSLIVHFETVLVREQPDEVMIPWPSYNQDHRAVYEAAIVALRPHDRVPFVPRVLIYEQPHVSHWDVAAPGQRFTPQYFVPIDAARKVSLYALMASQVRAMRSPEHIRALAAVRGAAIGVPYAEAYQVLRWVG